MKGGGDGGGLVVCWRRLFYFFLKFKNSSTPYELVHMIRVYMAVVHE